MKTIFYVLILALALTFSTGSYGQVTPAQNDTLKLLVSNANNHHKKLFLVFGWQGCSWCRLFDKYHNDSAVHAILGKYLVIAKVDIYKSKAGAGLYKTYGKEGTPSWTIFGTTGEVLIDSDNGKGNVGYPAEDDEIAHYLKALKIAAPAISEPECTVLAVKLKDYRSKKSQIIQ